MNKQPKAALNRALLKWKAAIGRGAHAAADIAEGLPYLIPATQCGVHGQEPLAFAGFKWGDFVDFDANKLQGFHDDLVDLKEQAERAIQAFEEALEARALPF